MKKKTARTEGYDNSLNTESNINPNFAEIRKNFTKSHNFKS